MGDASRWRESAAHCLRYWARHDFLDGGGLLTIGFTYPNSSFAENYAAPGGPFFALQAFLPLWLGADHTFWRAPAASEGPPREPRRIALCEAGLTVVEGLGHHRAVFAGQRIAWPLRERPEDCRLLDCGAAFSRWMVPGWIEAESTVDDRDGVQVRRTGSPWFSALAAIAYGACECGLVACEPNLNLLHPQTVLPYFREVLEPGRHERVLLAGGYGHTPATWRKAVGIFCTKP